MSERPPLTTWSRPPQIARPPAAGADRPEAPDDAPQGAVGAPVPALAGADPLHQGPVRFPALRLLELEVLAEGAAVDDASAGVLRE